MKNKKPLFFILLIIILFNIYRSFSLFDFKKIFSNKFNLEKYHQLYDQSQWVNPKSEKPVGDDIVYIYAGARYLLGENPIMINAEHPPLGKNLIGLSALYLKNEYFFSLFAGIFAIATFYILTKKISKDTLLSILLTLIIIFEPLIVANYFLALLDLLILGFLNLYFICLIKYEEEKKIKNIYLCGFLLGLIISTKFFGLSFPLIAASILFFIINKDFPGMFNFGISMIISGIILLINYFQFFLKGNNLLSFMKLQKYIYTFHSEGRKNAFFINGSFFELLFRGKYFINLEKKGFENHYSLLWPLSFFVTLLNIVKKRVPLPIVLWIITYSGSMLLSLPNSRYLILLLPYLYLSSLLIFKAKTKNSS